MLDDLSKTIKSQLYERASSPLLSSFTLSWAGWNYKFILVIFSTLPVTEKLSLIEEKLFVTWADYTGHGIIFPLLTALALIFLYPYPAKFVYEWAANRNRELKEIQQRVEDSTPLTISEAREIRKSASQAIREIRSDLSEKESEVSKLKNFNEELSKARFDLVNQLNGEKDLINSSRLILPMREKVQFELMKRIAKNSEFDRWKFGLSGSGDTITIQIFDLLSTSADSPRHTMSFEVYPKDFDGSVLEIRKALEGAIEKIKSRSPTINQGSFS